MPNYKPVDLKASDEELKRMALRELGMDANTKVSIDENFKHYEYAAFERDQSSAWIFEVTKEGGMIQYFDNHKKESVADPPVGERALVIIPKLEGCPATEFWYVKVRKITAP